MALTVQLAPQLIGDTGLLYTRSVVVNGDSSYLGGGYTVTPGTFGFIKTVVAVGPAEKSVQGQNYTVMLDRAFGTLRFFTKVATPSANIVEVTSGTNLTTAQLMLIVLGN